MKITFFNCVRASLDVSWLQWEQRGKRQSIRATCKVETRIVFFRISHARTPNCILFLFISVVICSCLKRMATLNCSLKMGPKYSYFFIARLNSQKNVDVSCPFNGLRNLHYPFYFFYRYVYHCWQIGVLFT